MRLLLDCDGVLCNFLAGAIPVLEKHLGESHDGRDDEWDLFSKYPKEIEKKCYNDFSVEGFCSSLPPYEEAKEAIPRLGKIATIYVVTAPLNGPYWVTEREKWLASHFGIPRHRVVHTSAKYLVQGKVFVDDKPEHVEEWKKSNEGGWALLWDMPYNRQDRWKHLIRATCWQDVESALR